MHHPFMYLKLLSHLPIEAGDSQRRPGLHVDSPGRIKIKLEGNAKNEEISINHKGLYGDSCRQSTTSGH